MSIDILPCYVDQNGQRFISFSEIAVRLLQPSTLDINLIGASDKEVNSTMKFFSLPQSLDWNEKSISETIERLLEGYTFIETNQNLRLVDIFYFCFLYRMMVEAHEDYKFQHPDL